MKECRRNLRARLRETASDVWYIRVRNASQKNLTLIVSAGNAELFEGSSSMTVTLPTLQQHPYYCSMYLERVDAKSRRELFRAVTCNG